MYDQKNQMRMDIFKSDVRKLFLAEDKQIVGAR